MEKNKIIKLSEKYDRYIKWSIEKFAILHPYIQINDIFKDENDEYYIYCPHINEDTIACDGSPISRWLEYNKEILCPLKLTNKIIENSKKLIFKDFFRSKDEKIDNFGTPGSLRSTEIELGNILPKDFPNFNLDYETETLIVNISDDINIDLENLLIDTVRNLQLPIKNLEIRIIESLNNITQPFRSNIMQGDLTIIPSRNLSSSFPVNLKNLWEEDQDFWVSNRKKILGTIESDKDKYIPKSLNFSNSSCIIDASTFVPDDIRNFLSIYNNVLIIFPLESYFISFLKGLGVNEKELIQLIEIDKVKLLLPQSIDRYFIPFINEIAVIKPENLIFSRRLTSLIICDARKRMPFLFPPFHPYERYEILKIFENTINQLNDDNFKKFLRKLFIDIQYSWAHTEEFINDRGTMGTSKVGLGRIFSSLIEGATGKDLFLESISTSQIIELAGALNSVAIPTNMVSYNTEPITEAMASLYSGINIKLPPNYTSNLKTIISEIFSIGSQVPVVDFANAFGNNDIDRFRLLISNILNNNYKEEEISECIKNFNNEIVKYEKRKEFLNKWDIKGLINSVVPVMPIAKWVTNVLINNFGDYRGQNIFIGSLFDTIEGIATMSHPCSILVSRMRKNLKNKLFI
jgi:hypothetical protein